MNSENKISAVQFALFRIVFGIYLFFHFIFLAPYAAEIYSNQGVLPDANANPTFWLFPSIFWIADSPAVATSFVYFLAVCSLAFTCGFHRRLAAIVIWWAWACLFNRNCLTNNPSLSYIGLILVLTSLVPAEEPCSLQKSKGQNWSFPSAVYWCAWGLMAVGYTFSGLVKLQSPSWVDGSALTHLMFNPLARPGLFREMFSSLPPILLQCLTWGALATEISFLPLSFFSKLRPLIWLGMVCLHFGILTMVSFADLTIGMLMIHLFTFDPSWIPARKDGKKRVVFYDGECGFCQRSIQIFLDMDLGAILHFAPLQGETAKQYLPEELRQKENLSTMVYLRDAEQAKLSLRADAILNIMSDVGGIFCPLALVGFLIPAPVRNWVYNQIAKRRKLLGQSASCRLLTSEESKRFLP